MVFIGQCKEEIENSMAMDRGGRLHAIARKAAAEKAPVLVIGLGGSGVDVLLRVKKMICDMIQSEKREDGRFSDKPGNIEYLGIDTDKYSQDKSYRGMQLNADEMRVYVDPHVVKVLPEYLPEYISEWLDCSIPNRAVIDGAGAVRQLGRLMLMENIGDVKAVLNDKIRKITEKFTFKTPLYVFIAAGISGGTGSASHSEEVPAFLPDRFEPGTPNIPGILGLHAALCDLEKQSMEEIRQHELMLTQYFIDGILNLDPEEKFLRIIGKKNTENRCAVVSVQTLHMDMAQAAFELDSTYGIMTRVGLHCAPNAHKTLGTYPEGTLRFSFGPENTKQELDIALDALSVLL